MILIEKKNRSRFDSEFGAYFFPDIGPRLPYSPKNQQPTTDHLFMSAKEDNTPLEIEIMQEQEVPDTLPVMPLKNFVLFPRMIAPLIVTTEQSKKLVEKLSERTPHFITALQRKEELDEANLTKGDIDRVGCVARMIKTINFPDGSTHLLV